LLEAQFFLQCSKIWRNGQYYFFCHKHSISELILAMTTA